MAKKKAAKKKPVKPVSRKKTTHAKTTTEKVVKAIVTPVVEINSTTTGGEQLPENIFSEVEKETKGKGGKPGMHHGHQYKPECTCGRCKKTTLKLKNQLSAKDQLILDESKKLPDGVGLVSITDESWNVMKEKVSQLKAAHPVNTEQPQPLQEYEFMNSVINTAISVYMKTL